MAASEEEKLKDYIDNLLETEEDFASKLKSSDVHTYIFCQLTLPLSMVLSTIESALQEYQPSINESSYYIGSEPRLKLFQLLWHLCNTPSASKFNLSEQCQAFRDVVAPKLHRLILTLVFPANQVRFPSL